MLGIIVVFGAMLVISRELIRVMPLGIIYTILSVLILLVIAPIVGAAVGILVSFADLKREIPLSDHLASGIIQGILFIIISPLVVFWLRRKQREKNANNALRQASTTFSDTDSS